MSSSLRLLAVVALLGATAACGSDGSTPAAQTAAAADPTTAAETDEGTTDDSAAPSDTAEETSDAPDAPAAPSGSGGTATLTLSNGEVFEFSGVLCTLEPQTAAGSEILFTATSYGDPGLDITQFGNEGPITQTASISVYDGNYDSLWEANTMFGTPVELALDGSTITGTASFLEAGDPSTPAVDGEVVANC